MFDGVHLGHRAILDRLVAAGRESGLPTILFTFHPRPVTVFAPETPPDELTPPPRKWRLLAESGLDRVEVLRFSRAFARVEPEQFLEQVLGAGRGLAGIWVGHDFRFGHRRRGDFAMLVEAGGRFGFRTERIEAIEIAGKPVSSSRIRACLRAGDLDGARELLGRPPDVEGIVVHGRGQGAKVLVATANLAIPETQCLPPLGVYAGEAEWDGILRPAVLNLGRRPTLTPGDRLVPEVHVLDWSGDLRGRRLLFRYRSRLREERRFASLEALRAQIFEDIERARAEARSWPSGT